MKIENDDVEQKETFGSNVGGGVGCLFVLIAIGILFNFDKVLDLIKLIIERWK